MLASRYQLQDKLGEGGMGEVYKALDSETGQIVAIKYLKSDALASDTHAVQRFKREAEILRQLPHPNIVKILDADFQDTAFIVMTYVSGGSLADHIRQNGPLSLGTALGIALETADALTRAHHLNILHRDLKPANILLYEDLSPCLSDFGLAHIKSENHLTRSNHAIGTLSYMSPEALSNQELDEKTDIWAFGVMLYEILTGVRPFRGDTLASLVKGILTDDPQPDLEVVRPDIPLALVDLVYRILTRDTYSRIPRMRLVGAELEAILVGDVDLSAQVPFGYRDFDEPTARFATPTPSQPVNHNLPEDLTPFVGREFELAELHRLIENSERRFITIHGPGGMGKTRLALEVARQQLENWQHGVYFVDLAPLTQADDIPTAIASATGFQFHEGASQKELIMKYLHAKNMLLVMDNFEHVLAGADLVHDLLQYAPEVDVLTTSRERLNLPGEAVFTISGGIS